MSILLIIATVFTALYIAGMILFFVKVVNGNMKQNWRIALVVAFTYPLLLLTSFGIWVYELFKR